MEQTRLFLIRHGQVTSFRELRFNGHTDVDLTPVGAAQLEAAAEDLESQELSAVYCSDLKRARFGGEALVRSRDLELRIEPAFREMFFGDWEGLSFDEVEERYPGALEERRNNVARHRPPGGESIEDFSARVLDRLRDVLNEHQGQNIALVAHSGVNRVILLDAVGSGPDYIWRIDQGFGCLNIVDYFPEGHPLVVLTNKPNRVQGAA